MLLYCMLMVCCALSKVYTVVLHVMVVWCRLMNVIVYGWVIVVFSVAVLVVCCDLCIHDIGVYV